MNKSTYIAISVGIFSGLWSWLSGAFGLITWIGFIGCTSYFASGGAFKGFKNSIYANMSGVVWAMAIIIGSNYLSGSHWSYLLTGFFSFVMCMQAKCKKLEFIPGAFCGCCCVFGTSGNWQAVIIALICGAVLGYSSDKGGEALHVLFQKAA